jgi:hypothetical protein
MRKRPVPTCSGKFNNRDCSYVHYCGFGVPIERPISNAPPKLKPATISKSGTVNCEKIKIEEPKPVDSPRYIDRVIEAQGKGILLKPVDSDVAESNLPKRHLRLGLRMNLARSGLSEICMIHELERHQEEPEKPGPILRYYCLMRKTKVADCAGKFNNRPCVYPDHCGIGFKSDAERQEVLSTQMKSRRKDAWDTYRKYRPYIVKK